MIHVYVKKWKLSECEPNLPKIGLDWWRVSGKPKDRWGLDFLHPWGRIDVVFTTNRKRYERDIDPEYRGWRLL